MSNSKTKTTGIKDCWYTPILAIFPKPCKVPLSGMVKKNWLSVRLEKITVKSFTLWNLPMHPLPEFQFLDFGGNNICKVLKIYTILLPLERRVWRPFICKLNCSQEHCILYNCIQTVCEQLHVDQLKNFFNYFAFFEQ